MKITKETKDQIRSTFPKLADEYGQARARKELARKYNIASVSVYHLICDLMPKKNKVAPKRKETEFYNSRELKGNIMVPDTYGMRTTEKNFSRIQVSNWEEFYFAAVNLK